MNKILNYIINNTEMSSEEIKEFIRLNCNADDIINYANLLLILEEFSDVNDHVFTLIED